MPVAVRGDTQIFWEENGSGEPLLLVMGHKWPRQGWHRQVPSLSSRFRVITFDNRGVGDTKTSAVSWTIADMAADAIAVLDAAGVTRSHIYGVSMGGGIAQEIALSYPDRVGAVILGCTAPEAAKGSIRWLTVLRYILPALARGRRAIQIGLLRAICYGPGTDPRRIGEDVDVLTSTNRPRAGSRAQRKAIVQYPGSQPRLPEMQAPVLVLHGDADRLVPLHYGEELARLIPGSELVVLPGSGHGFITDATDAANKVVANFLTANSLQPT
jgi:3-oxoadipate enol-lactonase